MTHLSDLKAKALAATPGPWQFDCGNGEVESQNDKHYRIAVAHRAGLSERIAHCDHFDLKANPPEFPVHPDEDMEFISAANPETVLKLLECIEVMRETLKLYRDSASPLQRDEVTQYSEAAEALARVEEILK